jgi:hypothetical protein
MFLRLEQQSSLAPGWVLGMAAGETPQLVLQQKRRLL